MASLRVVVRLPPRATELSATAVASPATSSADEDASDDQRKRPSKKRKSSYHAQKEAMAQLREQVATLKAQLEEFRAKPHEEKRGLHAALTDNSAMKSRLEEQRHAIAGMQSLVSSYGAQYHMSPLATFIHLPQDPLQRQHILDTHKPKKIRESVAFMLARCQFQDLRRQARQFENFVTDDGDRVCLQWEVYQFTQHNATVRRVFDEMTEFARTHEMALADKVGVLSIRESDIDSDTPDSTQVRMLSSHPSSKLLVEKNLVVFSHYAERSDLLAQPHGILVFESVDQDDSYPYQWSSRIRKDVSSCTMVVECPRISSESSQAVALVRWSHVRTHKSSLGTDEELESIAREGFFFDVMVETIREQLEWRRSA